jgi:DNA-binding NarL/FixJ family response regulator
MHTDDKAIRVLIVDDHPLLRQGIREILEGTPDIEVVGEAQDGAGAKEKVTTLRPNVMLLDLVLPGMKPLEIEAWVRTNYPETVTLVLTAHDRDAFLAKAIEAGVVGFLTKEEPPQRLVEAVRRAAQGEVLITGGQLARAHVWKEAAGERWAELTDRERQIVNRLARGQDTRQIAAALTISERTVETHIGNLLGKLGVTSRAEVVAWVWHHGLIGEEDAPG